MAEYRLTPKAEADLVNIARYTRREWGEKQRNKYIHGLFEFFAKLGESPQIGKARDDIRPGLLSQSYQRTHIVFYRLGDDEVPEILRILHARQDVYTVLKED